MREIKFRGKTVENTVYFDKDKFVYGSLQIFKGYSIFVNYLKNWFVVDPKTVGQYTGLKDKNGVEIYEGDIFNFQIDFDDGMLSKTTNFKCFIEYNDEFGAFMMCWEEVFKGHYGYDELIEYKDNDDFVVIGNIHDNPELLEEL
jgi:uncharacterized phage protein (TIGR01671 family)